MGQGHGVLLGLATGSELEKARDRCRARRAPALDRGAPEQQGRGDCTEHFGGTVPSHTGQGIASTRCDSGVCFYKSINWHKGCKGSPPQRGGQTKSRLQRHQDPPSRCQRTRRTLDLPKGVAQGATDGQKRPHIHKTEQKVDSRHSGIGCTPGRVWDVLGCVAVAHTRSASLTPSAARYHHVLSGQQSHRRYNKHLGTVAQRILRLPPVDHAVRAGV